MSPVLSYFPAPGDLEAINAARDVRPRTQAVRSYVRSAPVRTSAYDNEIHTLLKAEVAIEAAMNEWAAEFNADGIGSS